MIDFSQDVKILSQISVICILRENCVANTSRKNGDCFENSNCFEKNVLKKVFFFRPFVRESMCQVVSTDTYDQGFLEVLLL